MEKTDLRNALMAQLWRMYRMDIMFYLREFLVGETALLKVTADSEDKLMTMFGKDGLKQRIEGEE